MVNKTSIYCLIAHVISQKSKGIYFENAVWAHKLIEIM